jgi:hypothetical protein
MADQTTISVTEITVLSGKTKGFKLTVDGEDVTIPVDESLFTNYMNQFHRENPTAQQRRKFATLLNLMRQAYKKGLRDGKK